MNVRASRQRGWINLHHWPNHYKVPIGTRRSRVIQQLDVEPFIYYSKEPQPRMWNVFLVDRVRLIAACVGKVCAINAAGECIDRAMLVLLGLIQSVPACENQIRAFEQ